MFTKSYSRSFCYFAAFFVLMFAISKVNAAPGGKRHGGKISRAQFATQMDQREPIDDVVFIDDGAAEIFFFSEVLYMTGHKVIHRWEYEGKEVSRVSFDIGGPRWRVFSRKVLDEGVKGKWTVLVTDEDGWPLVSKVFVFGEVHKNKYLDEIMHGQPEQGLDQEVQPSTTENDPNAENKPDANNDPDNQNKPSENVVDSAN